MQGPQLFGASGRGPQKFGVFNSTPFIKPKPLTRYFRTNDELSLIETNARLISDPKVGFRTKFDILGEVPDNGTIVAQNISGAAASREFQISWNGGTSLVAIIGGGTTNLTTGLTRGSFIIDFDGTDIKVFKNSNLVETIAATTGTASEPTATTTIQARHNGSLSSYAFHYVGVIANVEVGDFNANPEGIYPINDNSNTIADISGNGQDGSVVNGNASDWELFNQQADGDWLGQELVVNGDFSDGSTGWTVFGTDANNTVSFAGGNAIIEADGSSAWGLRQTSMLASGNEYRSIVEYIVRSGQIRVQNTGAIILGTESASGSYAYDFTSDGDALTFNRAGVSVPTSADVVSISTKQLLRVA